MMRRLLCSLAPAAARRALPAPPRCPAPDGPHRPRPFEMSTSASRKNVDVFVHRGSRPDAAACVLGLPCASPHASPLAQHGRRDYFNAVPGASLWPVLTRPCMAGFEVSTEDYCAARNIKADIELVRVDEISRAYERVVNKGVRYRFVIDMTFLKA